MAILNLRHIRKVYPAQGDLENEPVIALDRVDLDLDEKQILCLLGPSGCGKSTLLRIIAGLEEPDQGRIMFDGRDMAGSPPHKRSFGMMFQEFALFPHYNVFENVAFGPRMQGLGADDIQKRTMAMLELVGLPHLAARPVDALSGGERQRVALARCLAPQPRIVMLDEPLGALDRELRERLLPEIRRILSAVGATAVFVTHDQSEAFAVADRIAVMHAGRILQVDAPQALYMRPATRQVANFLGFQNILEGTHMGGGQVRTAIGLVRLANAGEGQEPAAGDPVTILIRNDAAFLIDETDSNGEVVTIRGIVAQRTFWGPFFRLKVKTEAGISLTFDLATDPSPPIQGAPIILGLRHSGIVHLAP